jgi:hypothetical protein
MKTIAMLLAIIGLFVCSVSHAGEATVKDGFVFDVTFDKMVEVLAENKDAIMSETMGNAKVVETEGDLVTLEIGVPGRSPQRLTVKILADINFVKKRAKCTSDLVKSDGFITAQYTRVKARERDGKMYVEVEYHATVPEIGESLIRMELRRSMNKMVRVINDYLQD